MSQQLQPSLNNKAVPQTTPLPIKMEQMAMAKPVSASVGSQPAPLKPSQFLTGTIKQPQVTSPAVTAATKTQFQVMPSTVNAPSATQQMKQQYTLAPTPSSNAAHPIFNQQSHHHIQTSQPRLIPKTSQHQPTTIAPKIAPRPIAVQPKIAKSLDSSLNGPMSNNNNDKNVPCIITSKQWVLPPRPKAGRKPDKKKQNSSSATAAASNSVGKKGLNSTEIGSTPMNSTPSHGMTNLSDTLTNLNIQGSSSGNTPASSVVSSLNGGVTSEGSKGQSTGKNSISNVSSVKQKELKNQLDSATLENTKLKNIIEKLKLEIEQLQQTSNSSASPPISSPQTMLNSPSPLSGNPLTTTTTNASSTAVATPQFLEQQPAPVTISLSELDSPDVKAMTPVQPYEPLETFVSPTIDPTKIDLLIQENYKMDLLMKAQEEEKLKSKKAEPKKKRQYKKKKKVDTAATTTAPAVTMVKLEDTPSPLTAAVTEDALLSDLPNLTSILEDQGTLFDTISPPPSCSAASAARILDTVDEDEILHPFKRRSLKLERSVSLSDHPVGSRSTAAARHRQYSSPHSHHLHHSHTLGRSLSNTSVGSSSVGSSFTSPDFPQDSWSHSAGAFLNEDAMFDGAATGAASASLENQDIDMLINDESLNWDLLNENQDENNVLNDTAGESVVGLSRATTLTTVDWDEEEGNFVDVGSFW